MSHLLDVNLLIASIWAGHSRNAEALAWLKGRNVAVCPLSELGFLRISSNPKAIGASMENSRQALKQFCQERKVVRIPDDLPALDSKPSSSAEVTDHYLADLAARHGLKLATLDEGIKHPSVEVVGV